MTTPRLIPFMLFTVGCAALGYALTTAAEWLEMRGNKLGCAWAKKGLHSLGGFFLLCGASLASFCVVLLLWPWLSGWQ